MVGVGSVGEWDAQDFTDSLGLDAFQDDPLVPRGLSRLHNHVALA